MNMGSHDGTMCRRHYNKHERCMVEIAPMDENKSRACNKHK
jgi:hypothetical protein